VIRLCREEKCQGNDHDRCGDERTQPPHIQHPLLSSALVDMLIDQERNCGSHDGMSELAGAHRDVSCLAVAELPMHVGLFEESGVGHNAGPHAALTEPFDLDPVSGLTIIVPDAGQRHRLERMIFRSGQKFQSVMSTLPRSSRDRAVEVCRTTRPYRCRECCFLYK
jgi:hypothetical protein